GDRKVRGESMAHPRSRQRGERDFGDEFGGVLTPATRNSEGPSRNPRSHPPPAQPFHHLDVLWVQVAGSLCNLACTHCFVSCGPQAATHAMMTRADVALRVAEAA